MLALEIASFMVVMPVWEVLRVHTWTVEYVTEVMQQISLYLQIVTAIVTVLFCAFTFYSCWVHGVSKVL